MKMANKTFLHWSFFYIDLELCFFKLHPNHQKEESSRRRPVLGQEGLFWTLGCCSLGCLSHWTTEGHHLSRVGGGGDVWQTVHKFMPEPFPSCDIAPGEGLSGLPSTCLFLWVDQLRLMLQGHYPHEGVGGVHHIPVSRRVASAFF